MGLRKEAGEHENVITSYFTVFMCVPTYVSNVTVKLTKKEHYENIIREKQHLLIHTTR